jgi:hypothetical protein
MACQCLIAAPIVPETPVKQNMLLCGAEPIPKDAYRSQGKKGSSNL